MAKYASEIVKLAQSWIGKNEYDGSHKEIIDIYNSHKPWARGYKLKYTDAWCAGTISALSIKLGYTDIIPTECGCQEMIKLFIKIGSWVEDDAYVPKAGDIIFYDWQDSGVGDNVGYSDHVGVVEKVSGNNIIIIEGNYKNAVTRRNLVVNQITIRGYGVPKYDGISTNTTTPTTTPTTAKPSATRNYLMKGDKGTAVKTMQENLIYVGYSCGSYGADGDFGSGTDGAVRAFQKANGLVVDGKYGVASKAKLETLVANKKKASTSTSSVYTRTQFIKDIQRAIGTTVDGIVGNKTLSKLITVSRYKNSRHAVVKPLQKYLNALGYNCGAVDGIAGSKFDSAAKAWAKANGCVADGEFTKGGKSWRKILGVA